jgi:acetyl esterase
MSLLETLSGSVARGLLALPPRVQNRLAGGAPPVIDGQALDPQMHLLATLRERRGNPELSSLSPAQARARLRAEMRVSVARPTPVGTVADREIPGPGGALRARHYAPAEPGGPHPLLVFFHGGGFVVGDLDTHDEVCRLLCRHAGAHVLAVDYRLAPEHRFPAAAEDASASLAWGLAHAEELGADPEAVAAVGDSAGGNLAAVATQTVVADGERPGGQVLIYPATDMVTERPALDHFAASAFLSAADRAWYHGQYVPEEQRSDPRASPLLADSLAGLPPAVVVTAGFDPLRDEGEAYAAALAEAGVPVVWRRHSGLVHGFANMTGIAPAARDATLELAGAVRTLLHARSCATSVVG